MPRAFYICLLACTAMAQEVRVEPAEPSSDTRGTGSLEGIVSDAATHAPLRKAQVTLTGTTPAPLNAVTDAAGRFAFRELAHGAYWLNAMKTGYNPPASLLADVSQGAGIELGDGEAKKGIEIALPPSVAIGGHVVNEEGVPVRGCQVTAVEPSYEQSRRRMRYAGGGAATNDKGEYRLNSLAPGRYYVFAHCQIALPAAHPLLPRGDPRTPHETYLPRFYGGGLDLATATRLTLAAGASFENVDFRMMRVPSFTLRGSIARSEAETRDGKVNVSLRPADRSLENLMAAGDLVDSRTGPFQIAPVIPGSYMLFASTRREGRVFAARRMVEVGNEPPAPLEISLESGADLEGAVEFDSSDHPPPENGQVLLAPLDGSFFWPQPRAPLDQDGAFGLTGVLPGRWRLIVSLPGYVKSASLGGQPVSPGGFEIVAGAAGPLRIVMGTKTAVVRVEVTGAPAGRQVYAAVFPEDLSLDAGLERIGSSAGAGSIELAAVAPGRYRVFATDASNPWPILQRPDWLKAIERRTVGIEVPAGGRLSTTVEIISREELLRALEEIE